MHFDADAFCGRRSINIHPYIRPLSASEDGYVLKPLNERRICVETHVNNYNLSWHSGWFISNEEPRPNWGGL